MYLFGVKQHAQNEVLARAESVNVWFSSNFPMNTKLPLLKLNCQLNFVFTLITSRPLTLSILTKDLISLAAVEIFTNSMLNVHWTFRGGGWEESRFGR